MPEQQTPTTIRDYWARDKDKIDEAKVKMSFRKLQANAEAHLIEIQQEKLDAEAAFDKARMGARNGGEFQPIVDARLRLRRAKLMLEEAREVYKEQFGTEPKI